MSRIELEKRGYEDGFRDARNKSDYNPRRDEVAYTRQYRIGWLMAGGVVPEKVSA